MAMTSTQLGIISIPVVQIRHNTDSVAAIFSKLNFLPVRAENMFQNESIEYVGISDQFESIETGASPVRYVLNVDMRDGELVRVTAVREAIQ